MKLFLTLDIGTTSVKVCTVDERFRVIKRVGIEYKLLTEGGRVELDPRTYIDAVRQAIAETVKTGPGGEIAGIAVTTQGETLIPVDANGTPLHNAVVWLDARAEEQSAQINGLVPQQEFYAKTGIPECNGLCPVSKLLWFRQQEPRIYEQARYFLLLEDYILYYLTGRIVTEKSLLTTTGYFDIIADGLWHGILDRLDLDAAKIPPALDCGEIVGELLPQLAKSLGLPQHIRVVTGAMDQVCGAIGAGNFKSGVLTETTGTALCIGATRRSAPVQPGYGVPVYRHYVSDLQLLLPVCMTAGMALKWFKDTFCAEEARRAAEEERSVYDLLTELAAQSPPLSNGITLLPYFSGSIQPFYAQDCRASFSGIGLQCTKADFVRSILEGVGYMLKENLLLLQSMTGSRADHILSMGGGAGSALWCQIKADITGAPITVGAEAETASQGAAMLCAVALGVYGSLPEAFGALEPRQTTFGPRPEMTQLYRQGFAAYQDTLDRLHTSKEETV